MLNKAHDKEGHGHTIVKRGGKRDHDDGHGGAWKVAFADFCLALLALFLVLWLMAARQQQSLENIVLDATKGQIEGPGDRPAVATGRPGSLIERFPTPYSGHGPGPGGYERVSYDSPQDLAKLKAALVAMSEEAGLSQNLSAVVTPFGLRVMLHDTDKQGMFMRGSPLPVPRVARLLRKMGPLFERMENQMLIVGHTDSVPYSSRRATAYSNWTLSSNRALAARSELLVGGMRKESVLQVVGMADVAPLVPENTKADANRRIEILILTRAQARNVASMFGPGADAAGARHADEAAAVDDLRRQLAN